VDIVETTLTGPRGKFLDRPLLAQESSGAGVSPLWFL
jgi:hypothetical protein